MSFETKYKQNKGIFKTVTRFSMDHNFLNKTDNINICEMILKKLYTLVFLRNDQQILLGLKKRGFGVNKWNGFGGKVEQNETILDAAVRELKEECCMNVDRVNLKNIGHLEFTFEGEPLHMIVKVFSAKVYDGLPTETEEMKPKWFDYDQIPFQEMWLDDKYWFPYLLQDKLFYAKFHYEGFDKILNYTVNELVSLDPYEAK